MRIGIIGAGMIGATAARLFARAGHEVAVSNSRGPESLAALVADIGPRARASTVDEAARFGGVVLLAVPWRLPEALPSADAVAGKVVIDAMNPYAADGGMEDLRGVTSSEHTARRLPGARLVKAFNTIWYKHLAAEGRADLPVADRRAVFVAGDDEDAKRQVMGLIEEIGFGPVDTGGLVEGGARQQPGSPIYNRSLTVRDAQAYLPAAPRRAAGP
jgi:predicted dinucleotide-binding enzyme